MTDLTDGQVLDAAARAVGALLKTLAVLALALVTVTAAGVAVLATVTAIVLLLTAYTLRELATLARQVFQPAAQQPLVSVDPDLSQTTIAPTLPYLRQLATWLAQALCIVANLMALWAVIGWIGAGPIVLARVVFGATCLLPALLVLARWRVSFGAMLLGGLASLTMVAALIYLPPVAIPVLFTLVTALALLSAHRGLAAFPPAKDPTP